MARSINRLSARQAATIAQPGRHSDGGGLYLAVDPGGARRWVFLFRWRTPGQAGAGRLREMGLGSFNAVSLARAREKAAEARAQIADRIDPIAAKRVDRGVPLFGQVADDYIKAKAVGARSEKTVDRWRYCLEVHAAKLRLLRVDQVTTDDVVGVLQPIWSTKPDAGKNTRAYIEGVLDAAKARGHREGDNPARWRGHLDHLLSKPQKLSRGHHAAMDFRDVPAFVADLRTRDAIAARGLEFLILTAARSGEVFGARWSEVNLKDRAWVLPANRTKMGREHRVPLSDRAVAILKARQAVRVEGEEYVFPGQKAEQPLSSMAFEMLLRRMGKGHVTAHGFRSAFRDWAGETTEYPRELAELALAHVVGDQTERAYRRLDAMERRRPLMADWSAFCATAAS